jgi:hypothetical protein
MKWLFNLFKKQELEIKPRSIYAFTKFRKGEFLLLIKHTPGECLEFMQLPDRYTISLTEKECEKALSEKILDFIEQVPEDIFEVSKANINKFEKIA